MKQILESHTKARLIQEIQKNNVKGYSKLKKDELIKLMMLPRNINKFSYIKKADPKQKSQPKKEKPKPKFNVKTNIFQKFINLLKTGSKDEKEKIQTILFADPELHDEIMLTFQNNYKYLVKSGKRKVHIRHKYMHNVKDTIELLQELKRRDVKGDTKDILEDIDDGLKQGLYD